METATADFNQLELEQQMDSNSVLLLREMHDAQDQYLQQRLYEQAADQEASLISEVLEGAVITDFKFETVDGKLYLFQPNGVTDWQQMHKHGVLRARAKATEDVEFKPYVEIAEAELEESRAQEAMVSLGRPAAMVKLSLCGSDVMPAGALKKLGRDADQQRSYLRVSVFDGQQMHIHSRSIDGLSLVDGRNIADGWGMWGQPQMELAADASSLDILKNQIYIDENQLDVEQMHQLADGLVSSFDALQLTRTGKTHKAGRIPGGVDTYKFILGNQDLLAAHMDSLVSLAARRELPIGHVAATTNDLRYDIMSSFKQRLEGRWQEYGSLGESVATAGHIERVAGTQYGGCDTVIGVQTAEAAGYVNGRGGQVQSELERKQTVKNLREKVVGKGNCIACGAGGKLFGCNLCDGCNKEWCEAYERTGKQTPIKYLGRFRQKPSDSPNAESFGEYWARLGAEAKLKKLEKQARLTEAA